METITDSGILHDKNLIIIGGTGRNVGKTTLAIEIIRNTSKQNPVIGLKVSTHKKGEEVFHGDHAPMDVTTYRINVEKGILPHKDTAAMLRAGATEAYYIETRDEYVPSAWNEFNRSYNHSHKPVVCESRSLRKHVKPGLFILLINPENTKDSSFQYKELADYIYYYNDDLKGIIQLAQSIEFNPSGWVFKNVPGLQLNKTQPPHPDEVP